MNQDGTRNSRSAYGEDYQALDWLTAAMWDYYSERKSSLKKLDRQREKNPDWYKGNGLLGMMMYSNLFGGNLQGVRSRLDYIKDCGVNYLHLMPLLDRGADRGLPQCRDLGRPRFCHEPHKRGAHLGEAGASGRHGGQKPVFLL